MNYLMDTGNLSETEEMDKINEEKWVKVFKYYVDKGDYLFLTYWEECDDDDFPTPHIKILETLAEGCEENIFMQKVMKLPTSNEVRDIILDGAFTTGSSLVSFFQLDIRSIENKMLFSSEDGGSVVLLEIDEEDNFFKQDKNILNCNIKLAT